MTKQRLRFFENAPTQKHIRESDKYLYKIDPPIHKLTIIGTGTMGQEHMYVAELLGRAEVYGIYDTQIESIECAKNNFSSFSDRELIVYNDLISACNDPMSDALMICTPNYTHFDILKTAIKSGKPLFIEKPMVTNLNDAAETIKIADKYSSFIQVGMQYRYKAQYVEALYEALERKMIGDIKTISLSEYRPPFLDKVNQWNKFNCYSGGTLVEKCCHYFDLINLVAKSLPVKVYASGGMAVNFTDLKYKNKTSDIDDHAFVIIDYSNGLKANFTLNMFATDFNEEMIISGDKGRLIANESFKFNQLPKSKATLSRECGEGNLSAEMELKYSEEIEKSGHHGATYYEHIAFMDQLEGKIVDSATPLEGFWAMVIACAAQESIRCNNVIDIYEFLERSNLSTFIKNNTF